MFFLQNVVWYETITWSREDRLLVNLIGFLPDT